MNTTPSHTSGLLRGFVHSLPIFGGYFPIAFSFGVAATKAGLNTMEALFLSLTIYSGASQFVSLTLFTGGVSVWISIFTLLAMNLRHLLYGPSLLSTLGKRRANRYSWAWAFGLTDEVYAATIAHASKSDFPWSERWMLGMGAGAYISWISGTALGAYLGAGALEAWPAVDAALGFMLTALFLSLLLAIFRRAQVVVIVSAAVVCIALTLFFSATAGILGGMFAGAVTGLLSTVRNPAVVKRSANQIEQDRTAIEGQKEEQQ